MAKKKRKTLPKNFGELIKAGDIAALKAVFDECPLDAYDGFKKNTALFFDGVPDELVRWLVAQGANINARDHYDHTPLYDQARGRHGTLALLLELGADMNIRDKYDGDTPLHLAATYLRENSVRALLSHGADVNVENQRSQTPLAYALARCSNAQISGMAKMVELLLGAGAKITPDMPESVRRIGKDFEFHRTDFNKDYLAETEAGLAQLYKRFGVEPVARRRVHDGVSPITVTTTGWQKQHQELWEYLVPSRGPASNVQAEVIRITGRISDEIYRNGGANWNWDYRKMLDALLQHFATGTPLPANDQAEAAKLASLIHPKDSGEGYEESARLGELAVKWVLANPNPMPLKKPDYNR